MVEIHYTKCLRCDEEWAQVDTFGICEKCVPKIETEIAIVDLTKSIEQLETIDIQLLKQYKQHLINADRLLKKLLRQL